ncbi:MAG TPA: 2Fe-2S iron-sulfur cluster-binding protein, partial [Lacipirellulaceae bacterium]|nr:2Fe-2S iron-sulfur cluster-binding protein [Lacipirellulaceae bacterium]
MRDHLVLIINGARHQVSGRDGFLTLSDYLRRRQGLVGTKIVCSEGDCGACTVLVGRRTGGDGRWTYCPVDACIQLMFQLDGVHVVTVEGLRPGGELTAVQQAMVECHGSQCGFCTPGFVMAMAGAQELAAGETLDLDDWGQSLAGNLCRCTGYVPILDAAEQATAAGDGCLNEAYPAAELEALLPSDEEPIELNWRDEFEQLHAACPATLAEALAWLAQHPGARIVAGATDVGVRVNKTGRLPAEILDLNRVEELRGVRVENGLLVAGGGGAGAGNFAACGGAPP